MRVVAVGQGRRDLGEEEVAHKTHNLWQGAEGCLSAKLEGSVLGGWSWVRPSGLGVPAVALKRKLRKATWGKVSVPRPTPLKANKD